MEKEIYPVTGMSCAACATSVQTILEAQEGVKEASASYASNEAVIEFDPKIITQEALREALQAVGYDLVLQEEKDQLEKKQLAQIRKLKNKLILSAVFSFPLVLFAMVISIPYSNYIQLALATPILLIFGRQFFINGWKLLRHKMANMDTLVAVSTGTAFLFSLFNTLFPHVLISQGLEPHVYYEAVGVIITFILAGKYLEENAKGNTASAIKKLMGLQPRFTRKIENGVEVEIPISSVQPGDILKVRSGEQIPVDGTVFDGESYVDESMLTGEPIAVAKKTGMQVFAGTLNQDGNFQLKASNVGSNTLLSQIIDRVKKAQGSKAPIQKLVDKVAGIFVPVVMGIATISFLTWLIAGGEPFLIEAILAFVTVLVIACPCALGLATPTALMVGMGKGAQNGILIKDAESLESTRELDLIVFDKTGTLTEGKPFVTDQTWYETKNDFYENILYSLESGSTHPLANAVIQTLSNPKNISLRSYENLTGKGVKALHEEKTYWVGSKLLAESQEVKSIKTDSGFTDVYFGCEDQLIASFRIQDPIRETAKSAIHELNQMNIETIILSGDKHDVVERIATELNVSRFQAEMLPEDKSRYIQDLQAKGKKVAMIGDGINDAEALAYSDVSIAMGKGSDIAIDVAKITLLSEDIRKVPSSVKLSKNTVKTIRQNLFWAFIYNIIGIPIAAGVLYPVNGFLLNPMIAGAAMALSSVSVVSNSLRLKFLKL